MLETNEINETQEPTTEHLSCDELIERYARVQNISIEQAKEEVGAPTEEEILEWWETTGKQLYEGLIPTEEN